MIVATAFFIVRTKKFFSKEDEFFSMTTMALQKSEIDLWELGFVFAVQNVPEEIGRVKVEYIEWDWEAGRTITEIKMEDCSKF